MSKFINKILLEGKPGMTDEHKNFFKSISDKEISDACMAFDEMANNKKMVHSTYTQYMKSIIKNGLSSNNNYFMLDIGNTFDFINYHPNNGTDAVYVMSNDYINDIVPDPEGRFLEQYSKMLTNYFSRNDTSVEHDYDPKWLKYVVMKSMENPKIKADYIKSGIAIYVPKKIPASVIVY